MLVGTHPAGNTVHNDAYPVFFHIILRFVISFMVCCDDVPEK